MSAETVDTFLAVFVFFRLYYALFFFFVLFELFVVLAEVDLSGVEVHSSLRWVAQIVIALIVLTLVWGDGFRRGGRVWGPRLGRGAVFAVIAWIGGLVLWVLLASIGVISAG